ncbi:FMN-dependent NADH-azoreductase [Paenactinomyces guangxiensis]|uniref:FMN dependent NADH:quinone oxidoreductase n=1 Tax=Paenactinomyces guangxiensis TaxID=1490290 RepID=A0A7W2AA03_9BACL|nr:NAD(P)H-dependent oxidoreductase [Paenactinomyces guangxiensis]MBA4495737.1 NAD(P)H-dependent oxidoreductase [Paenactinomyces guangxiensis]MBH8592726.1 NAD(P)H-dependent oxidoreductase [Paenactinomyces guangxiensis]
MATVLYITANPKPEYLSVSLQVGREFLNTYKSVNPQDTIIELDLYKIDIPLLDSDVFKGWQKSVKGFPLNISERRKLNRINELTDQFVFADKYIFVTPLWNFGLPPKMKAYFDAVCIAGKTFKYTDSGVKGLLINKNAVHIQARGEIYSQGKERTMEFGDSYIRSILAFMGVTDLESIIAEGTSTVENYSWILHNALLRAKEVARQFARR